MDLTVTISSGLVCVEVYTNTCISVTMVRNTLTVMCEWQCWEFLALYLCIKYHHYMAKYTNDNTELLVLRLCTEWTVFIILQIPVHALKWNKSHRILQHSCKQSSFFLKSGICHIKARTHGYGIKLTHFNYCLQYRISLSFWPYEISLPKHLIR